MVSMLKGFVIALILLAIMVLLVVITIVAEGQYAGGGQHAVEMISAMGVQNGTY